MFRQIVEGKNSLFQRFRRLKGHFDALPSSVAASPNNFASREGNERSSVIGPYILTHRHFDQST